MIRVKDGLKRLLDTIGAKFAYAIVTVPNAIIQSSRAWNDRPIFHAIGEAQPKLLVLESHYEEIRLEVERVLNMLDWLPRYHDVDRLQTEISESDQAGRNWRVIVLQAMGKRANINCRLCPTTAQLLDAIPGVFQAFFSILEGSKSIPPHRSPYNGYLRYHLGIIVPEENSPRMRIRNEWVSWSEGASFLFDDTLEHEVINISPETRVVLIVDILRPMDKARDAMNRLMMSILAFTYARKLIRRSERMTNVAIGTVAVE